MTDPAEGEASAEDEARAEAEGGDEEVQAVRAGHLDGWHRLHPLSPVVRAGRGLIALVVVVVPRLATGGRDLAGYASDLAVAAVVLALGVVSWLVTRWRVEGADLLLESGLLRRRSRRYPLRQMQAIDVVQGGVARVLGLAELRLRMAGGGGAGRLASLRLADAEALRHQLLDLPAAHATAGDAARGSVATAGDAAAGSAATVGDQPRPELVLRVPPGRLLGSVLLSAGGLLGIVVLAGFVAGVVLAPAAAGASVAFLFAVATVLYRRINGGWDFVLGRSAHGLHLDSGLIQTTSETLPSGRVQALRVVEPLLWRPFGWCRVEAAVAGKRTREEDRPEGGGRRLLLPVGSYAEAHAVLRLVLGETDVALSGPPARARWKVPLSFHRLGIGTDGRTAVTTSGRLRRVSHYVPLTKVQSIRRTQGPVQRTLDLATVHLDTAGPRLHAALRDRGGAEAAALLEQLPAQCRAARAG